MNGFTNLYMNLPQSGLFHWQSHDEAGAVPLDAIEEEESPAVVLLDDAATEGEAQSPAAQAGTEARPEDLPALGGGDAPAVVANVEFDSDPTVRQDGGG